MKKLLKEYNPELLKEYDYNKNDETLLETLTLSSNKKVWWICSKNHPPYQSTCHNRIANKSGCPYCSNHKAFEGNSLATLFPHIAAEWNYTKNKDLTPDDVVNGSSKKVWWLCRYGHEWEAIVHPRTKRGVGCPECFKRTNTSFSEQSILYYLQKLFLNIINRKKIKINGEVFEADIYIEEWKIAIEYDGSRSHKNKFDKDLKKRKSFQEAGIRAINIREGELSPLTNNHENELIIEKGRILNDDHRSQMIKKLFHLLNITPLFEINVSKDRINILEMYHRVRAKDNLLQISPEIALQWHPTKNGNLQPEFFPNGSKEKVWWLGSCGHEWQSIIYTRTKLGYGCSVCSNLTVNETNSLKTLNPEFLIFWDYEKNNEEKIYPSQVVPSSTKKVWWNCSYGHAFKTHVRVRLTSKNEGCPYCIGRKVSTENSLGVNRSWVFQYWDFDKNKKTPYEFTRKSEAEVSWKCLKCSHTWEERIDYIERRKLYKCPNCESRTRNYTPVYDADPNTLLKNHLIFIKEWDYQKNSHLNMHTLLCKSEETVWWKCEKGHEWQRKISQRTKHFKDCPWCYSKGSPVSNPVSNDKNIIQFWDFERNAQNPNEVGIYSSHQMYWKCKEAHKWTSSPNNITKCPKCETIKLKEKNKKILLENEAVFREWDVVKNGEINLELLKMGSQKKYSWICKKEAKHKWESTIFNRIGINKNGCPYCSGKKQDSTKLLQNARPDVSKHWDVDKNTDTPLDVYVGSGKRRYWKCPICNHTWIHRIDGITKRKFICPACNL